MQIHCKMFCACIFLKVGSRGLIFDKNYGLSASMKTPANSICALPQFWKYCFYHAKNMEMQLLNTQRHITPQSSQGVGP